MDGRMSVRHTANAGVLITTKAGAVGVDLFSKDPQGLYEDTPADLQEDLLEEIGKGRIRVLLFTHGHGDGGGGGGSAEKSGAFGDFHGRSDREA